MKEQDNIMDENNQIESIEFEIFFSIVMQDTNYGYNNAF